MKYTTFNRTKNDPLREPMFFGNVVNVARYDQQRYPIFEQLIERQLSFFWRPEEVDISKDRIDYMHLPEHERHIFISNLKYQTLLDSIQGRSPNVAFLPIVSLPELETWIETWAFFETIHSRAYTHIIRGIVSDPSLIFEDIVDNQNIILRATDISKHYDKLIGSLFTWQAKLLAGEPIPSDMLRRMKKELYLCMMSVNVLEAIRFYVSFACSFAFAERKLMEGNAKIIKLIARDEALHLTGTQQTLALMGGGSDDPEMAEIAKLAKEDATEIFLSAAEQEKDWAGYLFKDGSMIGLNRHILSDYIDHITAIRMEAVALEYPYEKKENPIPWIDAWLDSDATQVAPQEVELSSYLIGQVDSSVSPDDLDSLDL